MTLMLVSVVIIFYNQTAYVRRAVQSVVRQTYSSLDIVVVDDGADESIEPLVREFSDSRVRFFRQVNKGPAAARNRGIREAKGEYIAFLDGDDLFLPKKIEHTVDLLKEHGNPVCIATTGAYVFNNKGFFTGRVKPVAYKAGDIINTSLVRPSCSVYHKQVFADLGGFPEMLHSNEDGAFNSVATQSFPVISDSSALTLYRQDDDGLARKYLKDYETGVRVMEDRLAYIAVRTDDHIAAKYRVRSYKDLVFGFISSGNLRSAKMWCMKHQIKLGYSPAVLLVVLSFKLNMNLYTAVRYCRMKLSAMFFLVPWIRFRKML